MRGHREGGQAAVELALLLPLLILILMGCIDLGRAFTVWLTLANGAREGARYGCDHPSDTSWIKALTLNEIAGEGLNGPVGIDVATPEGMASGNRIAVTTSYTMPVMTFVLFGGQPVPIRARIEMVILPGQYGG